MQSIFKPPSRRLPFVCYQSLSRRDAGLKMLCILRKYFTQGTASNPAFGSFSLKNYSKNRFKASLRVNFCRRAAGTRKADGQCQMPN